MRNIEQLRINNDFRSMNEGQINLYKAQIGNLENSIKQIDEESKDINKKIERYKNGWKRKELKRTGITKKTTGVEHNGRTL